MRAAFEVELEGVPAGRCSAHHPSSLGVRCLLASSKVGGKRDSQVTRERVARLDASVAGRGVGEAQGRVQVGRDHSMQVGDEGLAGGLPHATRALALHVGQLDDGEVTAERGGGLRDVIRIFCGRRSRTARGERQGGD
jgi:hypothetical protein